MIPTESNSFIKIADIPWSLSDIYHRNLDLGFPVNDL